MVNNLDGFAVTKEKDKPTMIEKVMRVLVGLDKMSQKTRVNLACYVISFFIYTAAYLSFGFLGVFIFGVVSLIIFEKIPYLTITALFFIVGSGTWMLLDVTGLGLKVKACLDWLFGQPFAKP
jgi:hypothetical protein